MPSLSLRQLFFFHFILERTGFICINTEEEMSVSMGRIKAVSPLRTDGTNTQLIPLIAEGVFFGGGAVFEVAVGLVSRNECNYKSEFDYGKCVFAASEQEAIFHNYLSSSYCSFHPPQCPLTMLCAWLSMQRRCLCSGGKRLGWRQCYWQGYKKNTFWGSDCKLQDWSDDETSLFSCKHQLICHLKLILSLISYIYIHNIYLC